MSNLQLHQSIDILPVHLQKEVADYVAFLCFKYQMNNQAKLDTIVKNTPKLPLKFGAGKHLIAFVSDDFDEPLADFNDYTL